MKITINTRTGQYKEEPTAREQKNTEQEDYELKGLIIKTFCAVLATKIMEGKPIFVGWCKVCDANPGEVLSRVVGKE